ncbi:unnamed protein product [Ambrosiozyma monospora]|uniref:Unnamed protein product n=1 Tax=Ambrosiozyma monospora TaxID=43982 RepID=A0ACB5TZW7_AMBMO|nr:unnamed protein product [Ambrosiozyma monospora]
MYLEISESLTDVVHSTIEYPVDDLLNESGNPTEADNGPATEPAGIEKLKQPNVSLLLSEDRLASYDHLTYLTFEHFNDQKFLRKRIKEILTSDLSPLDQRFLIQKLMSRSYLEKQKYKKELQESLVAEDDEEEEVDESEDESDGDGDDEVVLLAKDKEPTYFNIEENILGYFVTIKKFRHIKWLEIKQNISSACYVILHNIQVNFA